MVSRGVTGSVLITAAGYVYERLPRQTWMDHLPVLWRLRSSAHPFLWGVALGLVGLVVLTSAWWDLRREARALPDGLARVRLAAAAWAAPMLLGPPLFSGDGWSYVATGDLAGHGLSPYSWTPAVLPTPLRSGVAPHWLFTPSPYGPLSLAWGGAFSHVTHDPWALLGWYRLLAVLSLVLLAWAVPVVARRAGHDPVDASVLVVASPFVLAHGIGGLHNDLTMVALVMAALAVTRPGAWIAGAALVGVAAAVKAPGLVAAVGVVLVSVGPEAGLLARLRRSAQVAAVCVGVLLLAGWVTGLGTGWIGALMVPGREHTWLAITWVLGRWVRTTLMHAGPSGVAAVHELHPAILAKRVGLVLLFVTAAAALVGRRLRSTAGAYTSAAFVMLAAVVLSPAGHYWYFLWCVPLLACVRLPRPAYVALVAEIVTLGLTAPADAALHQDWLMEWSALAVLLVPILAALGAGMLGRQHRPRKVLSGSSEEAA